MDAFLLPFKWPSPSHPRIFAQVNHMCRQLHIRFVCDAKYFPYNSYVQFLFLTSYLICIQLQGQFNVRILRLWSGQMQQSTPDHVQLTTLIDHDGSNAMPILGVYWNTFFPLCIIKLHVVNTFSVLLIELSHISFRVCAPISMICVFLVATIVPLGSCLLYTSAFFVGPLQQYRLESFSCIIYCARIYLPPHLVMHAMENATGPGVTLNIFARYEMLVFICNNPCSFEWG